ncbi:MAG: YbaB/EbfC family nucleoid-associated protein, partial [Mariprofundaceae bacterium]|nr:YbaB/EbfC family nucleoid-associated protein [Mariprofundaceae bacterium]
NMQKMQEEMAGMEVIGEAGGGMVRVTMGGDRSMRRVEIDPTLWAENDKSLIEDLMAAASNAALQQIEQLSGEKKKDMLGDMPLPPGFSL